MMKKSITIVKKNISDNIIESAIILLLPIIMFLLLGPVETYYGNVTDFDFVFKDFIGIFSILAVSLYLLIVMVISLLPRKMAYVINRLICVASILCYTQGLFLNSKLSESDGTMINWDNMKSVMLINLIEWIILFLVLLFVVLKFKKIALYFSAFLSVIQLIAFLSVTISILKLGTIINHFQLSAQDQLVLGKDNVIVIVLDSTSANDFLEVLQSNEQYMDAFKDFVFYDNYDSGFAPTFPSMSHLLTGVEPDVNVTRIEWQESAWNSDDCKTFYDKMHEAGYVCNLFTSSERYIYGRIDNLIGKFDNLEGVEYQTNKKLLTDMLLKYSLFRYSPYILKPHFEVNISHFKDIVFYDEKTSFNDENYNYLTLLQEKGLSVGANEKMFVLTHLQGMHSPLNIDEYGSYCEDTSYNQTLLGNMYILNVYIEQLKSLGIYDCSSIIVMADHSGLFSEDGIGLRATRLEESLFMIKRQNEESSNIKVCHAPVHSDDFRATILDLVGLDYFEEGTSIYDWEEGQERERTSYIMEDGLWGYTYYTDGEELTEKYESGFDVEMPSNNGW